MLMSFAYPVKGLPRNRINSLFENVFLVCKSLALACGDSALEAHSSAFRVPHNRL